MGFAQFRASFVGPASNEWSVTPDDGYLKQHEETQFIVRYAPRSSGVHNAYLVIETEVSMKSMHSSYLIYLEEMLISDMFVLGYLQDFVKTWKVVGSTGEYEF